MAGETPRQKKKTRPRAPGGAFHLSCPPAVPAGSAAEIKALGDPTIAAIASELAGEIYGLNSLAENIEDAEHNTTRFLVMSKEPKRPPRDKPAVTTFVFNVRNVPAALYK